MGSHLDGERADWLLLLALLTHGLLAVLAEPFPILPEGAVRRRALADRIPSWAVFASATRVFAIDTAPAGLRIRSHLETE